MRKLALKRQMLVQDLGPGQPDQVQNNTFWYATRLAYDCFFQIYFLGCAGGCCIGETEINKRGGI